MRRPCNILIFSDRFFPLTGGVQTWTALLAEGLSREGQRATVVTTTSAMGFNDHGVSYQVVRRPSWLQLWRTIAASDVVQLAGPAFVPLMFALLQRKPLVVSHHGYQAICPNGLLFFQPDQTACPGHFIAENHVNCWQCGAVTDGWVRSRWHWGLTFVRRWMCQRATANIAVTEHVRSRIQLPHSEVIYNGVPDGLLEISTSMDKTEAPLCFGYVGRLVAEKGLPLLLEAAALLRDRNYDFRIKFIGDGPERAQLLRMVADKKLTNQVTFTGFLADQALYAAAQDVAVLVMPSVWEETAGLAAMEQMLRGRAVIAADIGGLGEVTEDAALKFQANNFHELAARMQQLLEMPRLVSELGVRARKLGAEKFRGTTMVSNYLAKYFYIMEDKCSRN